MPLLRHACNPLRYDFRADLCTSVLLLPPSINVLFHFYLLLLCVFSRQCERYSHFILYLQQCVYFAWPGLEWRFTMSDPWCASCHMTYYYDHHVHYCSWSMQCTSSFTTSAILVQDRCTCITVTAPLMIFLLELFYNYGRDSLHYAQLSSRNFLRRYACFSTPRFVNYFHFLRLVYTYSNMAVWNSW